MRGAYHAYLGLLPSFHQVGEKYHPAVTRPNGDKQGYWPNIIYDDWREAESFASAAIKEAYSTAEQAINLWNVYPITG